MEKTSDFDSVPSNFSRIKTNKILYLQILTQLFS
jgi:hypothetical protein